EPKHAASFISELVTDPSDVPDVQRISGYLGASSEEGYTRVYLTPDLNYSVDIKNDDILLEQPVPHTTDPLGAVNLWIKRNADIKPSASKGATQVSQQNPTWPTVPTWPTPAGQGAAPQGTFTPIGCGGGGGGFTFTPVTLPPH